MPVKEIDHENEENSSISDENQKSERPDRELFKEKLEETPVISPRGTDYRYVVSVVVLLLVLTGFLFVHRGQITGFLMGPKPPELEQTYNQTAPIPRKISPGEEYSINFDVEKPENLSYRSGSLVLEANSSAPGLLEIQIVDRATNETLCTFYPGKGTAEQVCALNKEEISKVGRNESDLLIKVLSKGGNRNVTPTGFVIRNRTKMPGGKKGDEKNQTGPPEKTVDVTGNETGGQEAKNRMEENVTELEKKPQEQNVSVAESENRTEEGRNVTTETSESRAETNESTNVSKITNETENVSQNVTTIAISENVTNVTEPENITVNVSNVTERRNVTNLTNISVLENVTLNLTQNVTNITQRNITNRTEARNVTERPGERLPPPARNRSKNVTRELFVQLKGIRLVVRYKPKPRPKEPEIELSSSQEVANPGELVQFRVNETSGQRRIERVNLSLGNETYSMVEVRQDFWQLNWTAWNRTGDITVQAKAWKRKRLLTTDEIEIRVEKPKKVVNKPPVLVKEIPPVPIKVNETASIDLDDYFEDEDNETLIYSSTDPRNITVVIEDEEAVLIPDPGFVGNRTIQFYAWDGINETSSNLVKIYLVEIPEKKPEPQISLNATKRKVNPGETVRFWVNETSGRDQIIKLNLSLGNESYPMEEGPANRWRYNWTAWNRTGNFTVKAKAWNETDLLVSDELQIRIKAEEVKNRPPVLSRTVPNISLKVNTSTSIDLDNYFKDPDNETLIYLSTDPENITISISGSEAEIIPDENFVGKRSVYFFASDGINRTRSNEVEISVERKRVVVPKISISASKEVLSPNEPVLFTANETSGRGMIVNVNLTINRTSYPMLNNTPWGKDFWQYNWTAWNRTGNYTALAEAWGTNGSLLTSDFLTIELRKKAKKKITETYLNLSTRRRIRKGKFLGVNGSLFLANGTPLANRTLDLFLDSTIFGTRKTNARGRTNFRINTTKLKVGRHLLNLSFSGGVNSLPSWESAFFELLPRRNVTKGLNLTLLAENESFGRNVSLEARLSLKGMNLPHQELAFYLNETLIGHSTTNESGRAAISFNTTQFTTDPYLAKVSFSGNRTLNVSAVNSSKRMVIRPKIKQLKAVVGKPVRWVKVIKKRTSRPVPEKINISTSVPRRARNLTIEEVLPERIVKIVKEFSTEAREKFTELRFQREFNATQSKKFKFHYKTLGPTKEEELLQGFKRIVISSELPRHLYNITSNTSIPEMDFKPMFYRLENGTWQTIKDNPLYNVTYLDMNNNSKYDEIRWNVPKLSNDTYGVDISILNVHSYPTVGGNWTVEFNTTGKANLTITPINGTTWSDSSENSTLYDLKFHEVGCGNETLNYQWINRSSGNSSVFLPSYSCNQTGYEISQVLTIGRHALKFEFGPDVGYAYNNATTVTDCPTGGNVTITTDCVVEKGNISYNVLTLNATMNVTLNASVASNQTIVNDDPGGRLYMMHDPDFYAYFCVGATCVFYNNPPLLDAVETNVTWVKQGGGIKVTTINASDPDGDLLALRCGDSPWAENLCNSSYGDPERSCSFSSPWSDDSEHWIYCHVDDSKEDSFEVNTSVIADNTPPSISYVSPTPGNGTRQTDNQVTINVTVSDTGSGVDQCILEWDNSTDVYNESVTPTNGYCEVTKSTVDGTTYNFQMFVRDVAGNENSTVERTFRENAEPTSDKPLLNSTYGTNTTTENLTVYPQNVSDLDNDSVTNITNWIVDGTPLAVLNMPFDTNRDGDTSSGAIRDYSGYGNNGTLGGGNLTEAPVWTDGKVGGAYDFDGTDDYVEVPDAVSLQPEEMTVTAWIYPNQWPDDWTTLIDKGCHPGSGWCFYNDYQNNQLVWRVADTDIKGDEPPVNTRSHIAAVSNGTYSWLYLNATLIAEGAGTLVTDSGYPVYMGTGVERITDYPFNGTIDQVHIYNRSLTPEQIQYNYEAGLANHSVRKIVNEQTSKGETWEAEVTPNDQWEDGITRTSNNLTIVTTLPTVNLTTPMDGFVVNENISFEGRASASIDLKNATLYWNYTGVWTDNGTVSLSGTSDKFEFNRNELSEGTYIWNVKVCDVEDACAFASENYTVTVDTTNPDIWFVPPTDQDGENVSRDWSYVNVSVYDEHNVSSFIDFDRSLVGYWSMDNYNSSGIYDDSTWDNFGSFEGTAFGEDNITHGPRGKALEFDGSDDYVDTGGNFLSGLSEFTLSGWVKVKNANSQRDLFGQNNAIEFFIQSGGTLRLWTSGDGALNVDYSNYVDEWHHVVGLGDGDALRIYIDGKLIGNTSSSTSDYGSSSYSVKIGAGVQSGSGNNFLGKMDDIRMWDRALSPEEINASYYYTDTEHRLAHNFTSLSEGQHEFYAYSRDEAGNVNQTDTHSIKVDTEPPLYFDNVTDPSSPATYEPDKSYQFNITWIDETSNVDEVVFEFNETNYSYKQDEVNRSGDEYYISLNDLPRGTYTYEWYANDTVDNWNSTGELTYQIKKAPTSINLLLNGTDNDTTYNYSQVANFTVVLNVSDKTVYLDTNMTDWVIQSNTTPLYNYTEMDELGTFNITGYFPGDENYTASSETHYATVQDVESPNIDYVAPTPANDSRQRDNEVTINASVSDNEAVDGCILEWDGSNESISPSGGYCSATKYPFDGTTHTFQMFVNDTSGNWNKEEERIFRENAEPTSDKPILNSTYGTNETTENITVYPQNVSDPDGDETTKITNWKVDGTPLAVLNMPFDTNRDGDTSSGAIRDYSGYGNNGTLGGGSLSSAPTWTDGKVSGAYEFDGSDEYVEVDYDTGAMSGLNPNYITITAWIYPETISSASENFAHTGGDGVVAKVGGTNYQEDTSNSDDNYRVALGADDEVGFYVDDEGDHELHTGSVLSTNEWYHIAATYDGSVMKIYINGTEKASLSFPGSPIIDNTNPVTIGSPVGWGGSTDGVDGTIDQVHIYNRSLTPEQIQYNYEAGLANHSVRKIVNEQTSKGETWEAEVTPNDQWEDGITRTSNNLTIVTTLPTVNLTTPMDGFVVNENVSFEGSASSDVDLKNATLYWNYTGSWTDNGTHSLSGTSTSFEFDRNELSEGTYEWNVKVCDVEEACDFASQNYTVTVDTTNPDIWFVPPTDQDGENVSRDWSYVNVSVYDEHNVSSFIDFDRSLVGYWSMDNYNSSGIYDDSTWDNFGSFNGGLGTDNITHGPRGKALEFDGQDDYINISDDNSLHADTYFTVEAWGYLKEFPPSGEDHIPIVWRGDNIGWGNDYHFRIAIRSDTCNGGSGRVVTWGSGGQDGTEYWFNGGCAEKNKWYHYVYVVNNDTLKGYINGEEVASDTGNAPYMVSGYSTYLGWANRDGTDVYTSGTIDEVHIYNRFLTPQEINASYYTDTEHRLAHNFTSLSEGQHDFYAYSRDEAGNVNQTGTRTIEVDTGAPEITVEAPKNQTYGYKSIDLNLTTSEPTESCWWNLDPDKDQTSGNETIPGSGKTEWYDEINVSEDGTYRLYAYCNDSAGNVGINDSVVFTVTTIKLSITKDITPDAVVARESEEIIVITDVKITKGENNISFINLTDEVPYDFEAPSASEINVTNIEYSPFGKTDITDEVSIDVVDRVDPKHTLIIMNVSDLSQTSAGYLEENDTIRLQYEMTSSELPAGSNRTVLTNATVRDILGNEKEDWINKTIHVWEVVLRGWKKIWVANSTRPQNISVEIKLRAIGGTVTDIYLADYLPPGTNIYQKKVSYWNETNDITSTLYNQSDYLLLEPEPITLPSGLPGWKYNYNFTYNFTNWSGNLFDNDSITIQYNVSLLGGGQWTLPGVVSAYDPTYKKHIRTEMYASANVPSFDASLYALTKKVKAGEIVKAVLKLKNVGGPQALVDVFNTYSVKSMKGDVLTQKSETFAVSRMKEEELKLQLPAKVEEGIYTFESFITYTGREAMATDTFRVVKKEVEKPNLIYLLVAVASVVGIAGILIYRVKSGVGGVGGRELEEAGEADRELFKEKLEEEREVEPRSSKKYRTLILILFSLFLVSSGAFFGLPKKTTGYIIKPVGEVSSQGYEKTGRHQLNLKEGIGTVKFDLEPSPDRKILSGNLFLDLEEGNLSKIKVLQEGTVLCKGKLKKGRMRCRLTQDEVEGLMENPLTLEGSLGRKLKEPKIKPWLEVYYKSKRGRPLNLFLR